MNFIYPDWAVNKRVKALCTTRLGGVSQAPYDHLNIALHVGDDSNAVEANRLRLIQQAGLPQSPKWLNQVHGVQLINADSATQVIKADGIYSRQSGVACAVMTADCLPLLIADREGEFVAAIHAGWRGLLAGIIEAAVEKSSLSPERLAVWLGPAISVGFFEVGEEVYNGFIDRYVETDRAFFQKSSDKWDADIYLLARMALRRVGIKSSYGGDFCTFSDRERFFSFRRDSVTGRMASIIWLE